MLRRGLRIPPMARSPCAVAQRSYIDYHHRETSRAYGYLPEFLWPFIGCTLVGWFFWLSCGTLFWESQRSWKSEMYTRRWKNCLGHGYNWNTGDMIESIYDNLPEGVEE